MSAPSSPRNYSLIGVESKLAEEKGLASADWYTCTIPRKRMKELMQRSDEQAIRDTAIWLGLLVGSGLIAAALWGSLWSVPFFLVYGVLYGSVSDSRWHECGHGTAFRTQWMNDAVYELACFMIMRNPTAWRWSHTRHHTDTIIVGRDPEIAVPRPAPLWRIGLNFFGLIDVPVSLARMILHAFGQLAADEATYVPETEWNKVFRTARVWSGIYAAVILLALLVESWLPLMLIGLPRLYGAWLHIVFGLTQHAGLAEDVLDHRLNTRTVYMHPVLRFLYWNMNYHVEHHMYPMVPFHALPDLHEEIKADTPPPYSGLVEAYQEIIPALLQQSQNGAYFVERPLPQAATTHSNS
jgi:fatty acid desaturase